MPGGFLAGGQLAPAACPAFGEAGGVGDFFLPAELPAAGQVGPEHGNQADDQVARSQQQGLDAVAELMNPNLLGIGGLLDGGEDEQTQAHAAPAVPAGVDGAPIPPMGLAAVLQVKKQAQQGLGQAPGALEQDKEKLFHRISSFSTRSTWPWWLKYTVMR